MEFQLNPNSFFLASFREKLPQHVAQRSSQAFLASHVIAEPLRLLNFHYIFSLMFVYLTSSRYRVGGKG